MGTRNQTASSTRCADLDGILVISIEQAVAAPYASRRLADAGARVIKVERPDGDFARHYDRFVLGQSAYYVWLNGGKESLRLDLRAPADRHLLGRMIDRADVLISNLKPGALEAIGFGTAAVLQRNPRIVCCEITGFGTDGPLSHVKAYDLIVQAESGLCDVTGDGDVRARVGVSVCDIAAGMNAHAAILQALLRRERTGRGGSVRVSLFDSVADWMNVPILQYLYGDHVPARAGVRHATIAPYGAFRCADGGTVVLAVQNGREWHALCACLLGDPTIGSWPQFEDNAARLRNRRELDELVASRLGRMTADAAMGLLESAGIACGRLNPVEIAAEHPHLRWVSVDTPQGQVRIVAPAARTDQAAHIGRLAALGEHDSPIRAEFAE